MNLKSVLCKIYFIYNAIYSSTCYNSSQNWFAMVNSLHFGIAQSVYEFQYSDGRIFKKILVKLIIRNLIIIHFIFLCRMLLLYFENVCCWYFRFGSLNEFFVSTITVLLLRRPGKLILQSIGVLFHLKNDIY